MSYDDVDDMYNTSVLLESQQDEYGTGRSERSYASLGSTSYMMEKHKQVIEHARVVATAARDAAREVQESL